MTWWRCKACDSEFDNPQMYSDNEHCPECRSIDVVCVDDEEATVCQPLKNLHAIGSSL